MRHNVTCDEAGKLATIQSPREKRRLEAVEQMKADRAIQEQERWRRVNFVCASVLDPSAQRSALCAGGGQLPFSCVGVGRRRGVGAGEP
jgi:hypothetical protein